MSAAPGELALHFAVVEPRRRVRLRIVPSMLRTMLLAAVLLAPALGAQYEADAPPAPSRVRGGLAIWGGGGEPPAELLEELRERAGGEGARLVSWGEEGARAAAWSAAGFEPASMRSASSSLELGDAELIWVEQIPALAWAQLGARRSTAGALRAALDAGALVGLGARAAEQLFQGPDLLGLGGELEVVCEYSAEQESLPVDAGRVRLGVEARTALVLSERFFRARGEGRVHAWIAASEALPARHDRVQGATRGDLIALLRSVQARHARPFPRLEPRRAELASGSLVMVGGGGIPPGLLERFIELAGGPEAPIVYVPCEYASELAREPGFVRSLRGAGARNVSWIHTKDRAEANGANDFLEPLVDAGGVWFGGGRQWNLVDSYQHTQAHALMEAVLARGGVIGGSSAGASIQGEYMARGDPLGNAEIMSEGYEEGLGFLGGVAIDQHLTQRGRGRELLRLVETYPQYLGIGIDESTALVVQGSTGEVVGGHEDRHVYFFDAARERGDHERLWVRLAPGGRYDLVQRAAQ